MPPLQKGREKIPATAVFVKFPGIPGAVKHPQFREWLPVSSWSLGADGLPGNTVAAGRMKINNDLYVTRTPDSASARLFLASANGRRFDQVDLALVRGKEIAMRVRVHDAIITGMTTARAGFHNPTESLSLNGTRIEVQYGQFAK